MEKHFNSGITIDMDQLVFLLDSSIDAIFWILFLNLFKLIYIE